MSAFAYVLSLFRPDRRHRESQTALECMKCGVNRRQVSRDEATAMLTKAAENLNDTITLNPQRTKELFEKMKKLHELEKRKSVP